MVEAAVAEGADDVVGLEEGEEGLDEGFDFAFVEGGDVFLLDIGEE